MHTSSIILITSFLFISLWIIIGLTGFQKFSHRLSSYEMKHDSLESLETKTVDMKQKTNFFLKKMELEKTYSDLHQAMVFCKTDRNLFMGRAQVRFVMLGPLRFLFK